MNPDVYGEIIGLKIIVAMLLNIIHSKFPDEAAGISGTMDMCHYTVRAYPLPFGPPELVESIRGRAEKTIDDIFSAPIQDRVPPGR